MAGNAMSLGHVVKVLLPLFSFLGYYQVVENPKKLAPVIKSSASGFLVALVRVQHECDWVEYFART